MSLFGNSKEPAATPEPEVSGIDFRQAVYSRRHAGHLGNLAHDMGTNIDALEQFCDRVGSLPMEILQKLAAEFFNARIDEPTGILASLNTQEPKGYLTPDPMGDPTKLPTYVKVGPGPTLA